MNKTSILLLSGALCSALLVPSFALSKDLHTYHTDNKPHTNKAHTNTSLITTAKPDDKGMYVPQYQSKSIFSNQSGKWDFIIADYWTLESYYQLIIKVQNDSLQTITVNVYDKKNKAVIKNMKVTAGSSKSAQTNSKNLRDGNYRIKITGSKGPIKGSYELFRWTIY